MKHRKDDTPPQDPELVEWLAAWTQHLLGQHRSVQRLGAEVHGVVVPGVFGERIHPNHRWLGYRMIPDPGRTREDQPLLAVRMPWRL